VARVLVSVGFFLLAGCSALRGPEFDPKEHVRGERQRTVQVPFDQLWPAVLGALPDEGLTVARSDHARGTIATGTVRLTGRDVPKRLAEIGDLSRAHRAGIEHVSELEVTYYLLLAGAGEATTNVRVRSSIEAVDRELVFFGPGLSDLIPRRVEIPSRGVLEQELIRRLVASLFTTEETLFLLGEPGVD
jgi:hypothetical protein